VRRARGGTTERTYLMADKSQHMRIVIIGLIVIGILFLLAVEIQRP